MNMDLVNIIFGMKVRQARTETGMTLTAFAERCDLSPSYVTEIEKGWNYPKADKIIRMAEALDKGYDELVSIKLGPSLNYLETTLTSPLLQAFPFEAFGLDLGDVINLLTRAPAKASALLHTMLEIGRQYNLTDEHFLRAALPSVIINETCERCPLTAEQCTVRAVPPTVLEAEAQRTRRREAPNLLMAELKG